MVVRVLFAIFAFLITSRVMKARFRDHIDKQSREDSTDQVER